MSLLPEKRNMFDFKNLMNEKITFISPVKLIFVHIKE